MNRPRTMLKQFINSLIFLVFWLLLFLNFPNFCTGSHNDHHSHSHHDHSHNEHPSYKYSKKANEQYSTSQSNSIPQKINTPSWSLWAEALGSTFFISMVPFLILFVFPLDKSKEKEPLLKILLSFASGGLLGDAFLHLIPHALVPHSHKGESNEHNHESGHSHEEGHGHDISVGLSVLLGILTFLLVEKCVRSIRGGHGHSHSSDNVKKEKQKHEKGDFEVDKNDKNSKKKGESKKKKIDDTLLVAGYLNLAADFTHNFTDGLAIGASYLVGKNIGLITTVTILLHEIPHEIGDFAILVQSGCSRKKAMYLQLVTAIGAVAGTLVSLMAEGAGSLATSWILPFTAGGFIYISTVTIIPELLKDSKFINSLKEIFAMIVGVLIMVLIADFE